MTPPTTPLRWLGSDGAKSSSSYLSRSVPEVCSFDPVPIIRKTAESSLIPLYAAIESLPETKESPRSRFEKSERRKDLGESMGRRSRSSRTSSRLSVSQRIGNLGRAAKSRSAVNFPPQCLAVSFAGREGYSQRHRHPMCKTPQLDRPKLCGGPHVFAPLYPRNPSTTARRTADSRERAGLPPDKRATPGA
jgi:hypothetical protein